MVWYILVDEAAHYYYVDSELNVDNFFLRHNLYKLNSDGLYGDKAMT